MCPFFFHHLCILCVLLSHFTAESLYIIVKIWLYKTIYKLYMVENDGFEPTASALQGRRSPS